MDFIHAGKADIRLLVDVRGVHDFQNHLVPGFVQTGYGIKRLGDRVLDVVNQLAVQVAADLLTADFNADIVPAIVFHSAGYVVPQGHVSRARAAFQCAFGIAPAADVPPHQLVIRLTVENNQESFIASKFAGLKRQGVVGPGRIAGRGETIGVVGCLPECAVLDFPLAAHCFPARAVLGKIAGKKGLLAFGHFNVLVFGLGDPGAKAD